MDTGIWGNPKCVRFFAVDGRCYLFNTEDSATSWDTEIIENVKESKESPNSSSHREELSRPQIPGYSDDWKSRPARKQVDSDISRFSYTEGKELYNIWYHRESGFVSRHDKVGLIEPALTACDPENDSGWTIADSKIKQSAWFCYWFAKGACNKGSECEYRHRIPTLADDLVADPMFDVFGRRRHADHQAEMGGVGSFLKECKGLYVSEILLDRSQPDSEKKVSSDIVIFIPSLR